MTVLVIHGLEDALSAIDSACASNTKIDLITAPAASAYIGAAMFKTIVDEIRRHGRETVDNIYYDCGPHRGHVLAGLKAGLTQFCLDDSAATPALYDIAAQHGATIMPRPAHCEDTPVLMK